MLADILQTCLVRIDAGASVNDCLAAYPQQHSALEAPLKAAAQIRALPRPALPVATRSALETRMLALAAARRAAASPAFSSNGHVRLPVPNRALGPAAMLAGLLRALGYRGPLALPWLRLASAAIALVLALALGTGALAAARAIVRAIQGPSRTPTVTLPATTPFTLDGPIEQITRERWVVNGITVVLDAQTTIKDTPRIGAIAHVGGELHADATLLARSIIVEAPQLPSTSAPIPPLPSAPNIAPTTIPVPPLDVEPDESDESDESGKPGKPDKPGKPGKGKGRD
ncbi:MAG TPA: DUF5666 domain-containing protein [Roseiflexaceae bacterium]|nr:DUF5666 domain-containing protein [Roseiflexaceae bacterium]